MTVLELPFCPACASPRHREFTIGGGHVLRICDGCGTICEPTYVDPAEVYVEGYARGEVGGFGIDKLEPAFQAYLQGVARRRIELIERVTGARAGSSLLDVGCGTGEVLAAAASRGWDVTGVEPERAGAEIARRRGLDVRIALLEEADLPVRAFDVVGAFHVLEHLPDSPAFLGTLARHVRPGGFVVVEVPNWASVQRRRVHADWWGLRPGEHLVHFTPATLASTFRRAGIEPVAVRSPSWLGPPQTFEQALHDLGRYGRIRRLIPALSSGRVGEGHRPTRAGWALLHAIAALYDRAGVGSVVLCVGAVTS